MQGLPGRAAHAVGNVNTCSQESSGGARRTRLPGDCGVIEFLGQGPEERGPLDVRVKSTVSLQSHAALLRLALCPPSLLLIGDTHVPLSYLAPS